MTFNKLAIVTVLLLIIGCDDIPLRKSSKDSNLKKILVSPGNRYTAHIKMVPSRKDGFERFWIFEIRNEKNKVIICDRDRFPGQFKIYRIWDEKNRLWIYNSDDNKVYFYRCIKNECGLNFWGWGRNMMNRKGKPGKNIFPPQGLFPDYVK